MVQPGPWNLSIGNSLGVRNFLVTFLGGKILSKIFFRIFMGRRMDFLGQRCGPLLLLFFLFLAGDG